MTNSKNSQGNKFKEDFDYEWDNNFNITPKDKTLSNKFDSKTKDAPSKIDIAQKDKGKGEVDYFSVEEIPDDEIFLNKPKENKNSQIKENTVGVTKNTNSPSKDTSINNKEKELQLTENDDFIFEDFDEDIPEITDNKG